MNLQYGVLFKTTTPSGARFGMDGNDTFSAITDAAHLAYASRNDGAFSIFSVDVKTGAVATVLNDLQLDDYIRQREMDEASPQRNGDGTPARFNGGVRG